MDEKSLEELLKRYEDSLVGSSFSVIAQGRVLFSFSFQLSDFIHLTGIHHILFGTQGARTLRGMNGVSAIYGGGLTRARLQSINGSEYSRNKSRIDGMSFLCEQFFDDPGLELYDFDPLRSPKPTKLPKGYVFLSSDGLQAFFFEVKKGKTDFIPASFFPCRPSVVDNQISILDFALLRTKL